MEGDPAVVFWSKEGGKITIYRPPARSALLPTMLAVEPGSAADGADNGGTPGNASRSMSRQNAAQQILSLSTAGEQTLLPSRFVHCFVQLQGVEPHHFEVAGSRGCCPATLHGRLIIALAPATVGSPALSEEVATAFAGCTDDSDRYVMGYSYEGACCLCFSQILLPRPRQQNRPLLPVVERQLVAHLHSMIRPKGGMGGGGGATK